MGIRGRSGATAGASAAMELRAGSTTAGGQSGGGRGLGLPRCLGQWAAAVQVSTLTAPSSLTLAIWSGRPKMALTGPSTNRQTRTIGRAYSSLQISSITSKVQHARILKNIDLGSIILVIPILKTLNVASKSI